jgi:hypothetical protein
VTFAIRPANYKSGAKLQLGHPIREIVIMHLGYWLQFWWMFPVALTICITV